MPAPSRGESPGAEREEQDSRRKQPPPAAPHAAGGAAPTECAATSHLAVLSLAPAWNHPVEHLRRPLAASNQAVRTLSSPPAEAGGA
jgi:hypothetical protein